MKRVSKCLLGAAVLLLLGEAVCSANLIAYNTGKPTYDRVMVVDDAGGIPIEVYEGVSVDSISAEDSDGFSWILFADWDGVANSLYKVRADGVGVPEKVLCGEGTVEGVPYWYIDHPQWSPDGSQILVWLLGDPHDMPALLPADPEDPENCSPSDLTLLPELEEGGWGVESHVTWSGDGNFIAHFSSDSEDRTLLMIRDKSKGWEATSFLLDPTPLAEASALWLDWQRHGSLITFTTRESDGRRGIEYVLWIDTDDGSWDYLRDQNGERVRGHRYGRTSPTWSPDDQYLLFTEYGGDLVKWTFPNGPGEVIGKGVWADWQRDAVVATCSVDTDCNDLNDCTVDTCNWGECLFANEADGTPCGGYSLCRSGSCFEAECDYLGMPGCDDFNECTTEECSPDYECLYELVSAGTVCTDDGDFCTVDACDGAGVCESVFDPDISGCEPACGAKGEDCTSGADCCSGLCHPVKLECK